MKKWLTLFILLLSLPVFSQYTPQEIKKFKISKITTLSATKGNEAVQKNETWYDENGNDTAQYNDGKLYRRTRYEYNSKGQVITRIRYGADGNEAETAAYTYNPDGSCTVTNTDKSFGMTDLTYCNKAGKTTKTVSPDKTERIYTYDPKGKLLHIRSKPDNGGVVTDIQYTNNVKGQLVKEVSKGDYKWIAVYTYDIKGMIARVKRDAVTDGVPDAEVITTYEYEFRK